ncbi:potassium channel family protein [Deinococcus multiflagellatus]|uniref:Potassium channel family protein n=1 Tax=Deinococcus multiflagellatus TaxID=1656887 RepID=A0ABW1ZF74_9DEIO|nr:potassium channel family protein [Deinococcus multiflagellatus]MBZ9712025.1 potassium channel family protein [Deinococcus multiflagellatus]
MRQLLWIPGLVLVVGVLVDLLVTCIQAGEGRLNRAAQRLLYAGLHLIAQRTRRRGVLYWSTPVLITGSLVVWTMLTWLGWTLIFWSQPGALIGADSGQPATFLATFYFVGYTLSTLGLGEIIAPEPMWRILTDVAAISGFFLLTFAITFIVPVAQARADRRELALALHRAGPGAQALILNAYTDHDRGLHSLTVDLHSVLNRVDAAHMNTPYLHRLRDHHAQDALDLHLPALGEALLILFSALDAEPPRGLRRALTSVDSLSRTFVETQGGPLPPPPPFPDLGALRRAGLPLKSDAELQAGLHAHAELRRRLHAMSRAGLWDWAEVAEPQGTPPLNTRAS